MRLLFLPALLCLVLLAGPSAFAQEENRDVRRYMVDEGLRLARTAFLTAEHAFTLALVSKSGRGGSTQKSYAQAAEEFVPLRPGNCLVVAKGSLIGGNIWLMLNNAAVDEIDATDRTLRVVADHYSAATGDGEERPHLRRNRYKDLVFKLNPTLGPDNDPSMRVVFRSNVQSSVAVRLSIDAPGAPDLDERVAGSYLLIFDRSVLEDGYFPECRRRRLGLFSRLSTAG
jgi:hypothetical protein